MTLASNIVELIDNGPLVDVDVRLHPAARAKLKQEMALFGEEPSMRLKFLVDTGASHSMLDEQIVLGLRVESMGTADVKTASNFLRERPVYPVELHVYIGGRVVGLSTSVISLPADGLLASRRFQGLLGRSSLRRARFKYDGAAGTFDIEAA